MKVRVKVRMKVEVKTSSAGETLQEKKKQIVDVSKRVKMVKSIAAADSMKGKISATVFSGSVQSKNYLGLESPFYVKTNLSRYN